MGSHCESFALIPKGCGPATIPAASDLQHYVRLFHNGPLLTLLCIMYVCVALYVYTKLEVQSCKYTQPELGDCPKSKQMVHVGNAFRGSSFAWWKTNWIYPVWFIKGAVLHECWSTGHKTPVYLLMSVGSCEGGAPGSFTSAKKSVCLYPPPPPPPSHVPRGGNACDDVKNDIHAQHLQAVFFQSFISTQYDTQK